MIYLVCFVSVLSLGLFDCMFACLLGGLVVEFTWLVLGFDWFLFVLVVLVCLFIVVVCFGFVDLVICV